MDRGKKWIGGTALVLAVIGAGTGIAIATGGDDDTPLAGYDLERATAAALAETGGGTVIETEVGDDGAAYGVEIRLEDGSVVEVNLDSSFDVIGSSADDDGSEGEGSGDEDGGSDG